jgi:hypothetical protein
MGWEQETCSPLEKGKKKESYNQESKLLDIAV